MNGIVFQTSASKPTSVDFAPHPIPAGFFCPGSAPFNGHVELKGVGPVTLRPMDSDLSAFRQIFYDREYQVEVPMARQAMQSRYEELLAAIKRMSRGRLYYNPLRSRAI